MKFAKEYFGRNKMAELLEMGNKDPQLLAFYGRVRNLYFAAVAHDRANKQTEAQNLFKDPKHAKVSGEQELRLKYKNDEGQEQYLMITAKKIKLPDKRQPDGSMRKNRFYIGIEPDSVKDVVAYLKKPIPESKVRMIEAAKTVERMPFPLAMYDPVADKKPYDFISVGKNREYEQWVKENIREMKENYINFKPNKKISDEEASSHVYFRVNLEIENVREGYRKTYPQHYKEVVSNFSITKEAADNKPDNLNHIFNGTVVKVSEHEALIRTFVDKGHPNYNKYNNLLRHARNGCKSKNNDTPPSYETISEVTNIPCDRIRNIFMGRTPPTKQEGKMLTHVFCMGEKTKNKVMNQCVNKEEAVEIRIA